MPGVVAVSVNFGAATIQVSHVPEVSIESLQKTAAEAGYHADPEDILQKDPSPPLWCSWKVPVTAASGFLTGMGFLFAALPGCEGRAVCAYALAMLVAGLPVARIGFYGLRARILDMNVLMLTAAAGAAFIGEWSEGATVLFLYSLGQTLEGLTLERTRRSLRALMDLAPNEASVLRSGEEIRLPIEQIAIGDILLVRPGERIAMDGVIVEGNSAINQAPITGESSPVDKAEGDAVFAGTINGHGVLEVRVTRSYRENTLSRIIYLVEEAQGRKAPSQRFVDRFARIYTPTVIGLAALIAIVPPLLFSAPFAPWFYKALTLLVISCPCALVISTPVAIVAAIGSASRSGVLIKGGAYLEAVGGVKAVAFDKTGTLTRGQPQVVDIVSLNGLQPQEILRLAASLESRSEHPLARAIVRKAEAEGMELLVPSEIEILPGRGLRAILDGQEYAIGTPAWLAKLPGETASMEAVARLQEEGRITVLMAAGQTPIGAIALSDVPRPAAKSAIQDLKKAGIRKVVMLTGDHPGTAQQIAREVEIDEVRASLLPEDKVEAVQALSHEHGGVAMLGDGINDAPALAAATVGIAMGAAGADAALETADIALMGDDLSKLPYLVRLSRHTLGIIRQNIAFSLIVKFVFLALAVSGMANLWMAVFADTGCSLIVIANSMRLLKER